MIGIFDSGIGGLTVVRSLMKQLPDYDIIYFGDTARTPYGSKSPETVVGYALENTELLLKRGAKIVVMACNTASSVASDRVAKNFDIPIFEVISPASAKAVKSSRNLIVGVIGTRATVKSGIYEKKNQGNETGGKGLFSCLSSSGSFGRRGVAEETRNCDDTQKISASFKSKAN